MNQFKTREIVSLDFQWWSIDVRIQKIRDILDTIEPRETLSLSQGIFMIRLTWGEFILLYENEEKRRIATELFKKHFIQVWMHSKEIAPWIQIGNVIWPFQYHWNIWLWVESLNRFNPDATNLKKWIYKWIILDPEQYFQIENSRQDFANKVFTTIKAA